MQEDHHPAKLVEQSLGTVKFTKTILKPLIFDAKEKKDSVANELRTFAV